VPSLVNLRSPSIFGKVSDQSLVLIRKYCSDHSLFGNPSLFGIVANLLNLTKQSLHWTTGYPIGTCLDQKTWVQNTFACHNGTNKLLWSKILYPDSKLLKMNQSCAPHFLFGTVDFWHTCTWQFLGLRDLVKQGDLGVTPNHKPFPAYSIQYPRVRIVVFLHSS